MGVNHHEKILKFRGYTHQIIIKLLAFNFTRLREKSIFSTKQKLNPQALPSKVKMNGL